MAPPGIRRVKNVERYQFHTLSRWFSLSASSRSLNGSSMIPRCAPRPVVAVPTPAAK
jgi:hypothetical protein